MESLIYAEQVPSYSYHLPCVMRFRTHIPSVEDDEGWHYFPCRRCGLAHAMRVLVMFGPRHRYTASTAIDEAIVKDRILADLRATWGLVSAQELALRHGKQVALVYRIGRDLGVWT